MKKLELDGKWKLNDDKEEYNLIGNVPGDICADLLKQEILPDPYYRENELEYQWIGERGWIYEREFNVDDSLFCEEKILLQCDGLDTVATIFINDKKVANTDNMFRIYEWDIKEHLNPGSNNIRIEFQAINPYTRKKYGNNTYKSKACGHPTAHAATIRKEACNFGWDWGPILVTCGIWRSIRLVGFSTARLSDIYIKQKHSENNVVLDIEINIDSEKTEGLVVKTTVSLNGLTAAESKNDAGSPVSLHIKDPELWWPAGMGEQPLYEVKIELKTADGKILDSQIRKIGLRTLELDRHKDEWGESFQFLANGIPFFAKGADWIPADAILARRSPEMYRRLLEDSKTANMNMIRVWGGGIYEEDYFYDICDELGICIWQDFMFACMAYPTWDKDFMATVAAEAEDNIKRIRNHPCLAIWCGNNELEMGVVSTPHKPWKMTWEDYAELFDKMLAEQVEKFDPQTVYWPCSPHSPNGDREDFNNPECGDAHLWAVWHGKQPFEWYRTAYHRFCSEFGFQSFPEFKTVKGYTDEKDRNVTTAVMEHHQRSGIGNTTIMQYMLDWFQLPTDFAMNLRASQILQGMAITYAVEHWRRNMPQCMGALYWQLNDCWPVASWASIDFHGRWKALHYMAKRFFAPVMISGVEDPEKNTVEIHVSSDLLESNDAILSYTVTDTEGAILEEGRKEIKIPANSSSMITTLDLTGTVNEIGLRKVMVWVRLETEGQPVSSQLVTFVKPKHIELSDTPEIRADIEKVGDIFQITLNTSKPALWAWLEFSDIDTPLSDNFMHLRPGVPVTVELKTEISVDDLKKQMSVYSLADTYKV